MKQKSNIAISFFILLLTLMLFQNCGSSTSQTTISSSTSSNPSLNFQVLNENVSFNPVWTEDEFTGYDVIVIAGQSNAVGVGKWNDLNPWVDPYNVNVPELDNRILQVSRYLPTKEDPKLSLVSGDITLQHYGYKDTKNFVGFGMAFARRYVAGLSSKRKVILVPAAMGGTSIYEWLNEVPVIDPVTGNRTILLNTLLGRLNFAMNQKKNNELLDNKFVALLWQHGEADIRTTRIQPASMDATMYVNKIDSLFQQIKAAHPTQDFSLLIGEPVPTWISLDPPSDPNGRNVEIIKQNFKTALKTYTDKQFKRAYVETLSAPGETQLTSNLDIEAGDDGVHFNAKSQIELANRYYKAYLSTVASTLAGVRITNTQKFNTSVNIVDEINRNVAGNSSHLLDLELPSFSLPVKVGVDNRGGGYINRIEIYNSENQIEPYFGRGMQTAFRDELHNGRYNPTQAGYMDDLGAQVTVINTGNSSLRVQQFNAPLFCSDNSFDYIQANNIDQPPSYLQSGDRDFLVETGTFNDEITSEFDYSGKIDRVSDIFEIPAFEHSFYFAYNRKPSAIKQFTHASAVRTFEDGNTEPVLQLSKTIRDISTFVDGNQRPSPTDLSDIEFKTLSGRFKWSPELFNNFYYYYKTGDNWVGNKLPISPLNGSMSVAENGGAVPQLLQLSDFTEDFKYTNAEPVSADRNVGISDDVFIISNVCIPAWYQATCDQPQPAKKISIGYYYPKNDRINEFPVVVMNRSDLSIHREESRIMQLGFGLGYRDEQGHYATPRVELRLSGLLSPLRYESVYYQNRFEAIRQKIFILFAQTPVQIKQAVEQYKLTPR